MRLRAFATPQVELIHWRAQAAVLGPEARSACGFVVPAEETTRDDREVTCDRPGCKQAADACAAQREALARVRW